MLIPSHSAVGLLPHEPKGLFSEMGLVHPCSAPVANPTEEGGRFRGCCLNSGTGYRGDAAGV